MLLFWPWAERAHRLDALLTQYVAPPFGRAAQHVVIHDLLFESDPAFFPRAMRWRLRALCRLSARRAARVLTVSAHAADEIARRYGVPAARIAIARNAVSPHPVLDAEAEREARALRPFLLCVGRLEPRKNVALALEASAGVRDEGARLVVVGREDFGSADLASALRRAPGVIWLQDLPPARLAALYRHAAALVFPSLGEGFGLPVLEALSYGAAVIASGRGAIQETGGALPAYFDPEAPDATAALAGLMAQALSGGLRPDPAGLAAHLSRFDWRESARVVAAFG